MCEAFVEAKSIKVGKAVPLDERGGIIKGKRSGFIYAGFREQGIVLSTDRFQFWNSNVMSKGATETVSTRLRL